MELTDYHLKRSYRQNEINNTPVPYDLSYSVEMFNPILKNMNNMVILCWDIFTIFYKDGWCVMLRIAICDDDEQLCSELESRLLALGKKYSIRLDVSLFYTGEGLLNYMRQKEQFDFIYLDIELTHMQGVVVGERIREELKDESVKLIYISAKESYAMDLFETRPMNFLLKPIDEGKFEKVFLKAVELSQQSREFFVYTSHQVIYRQPIKDIIFFECVDKRIRMVLADGEELFYSRVKAVEEQVAPLGFLKIHKSLIVNPRQIIKHEYDQLTMTDGSVLPIAQSMRSKMRKAFMTQRKGQVL